MMANAERSERLVEFEILRAICIIFLMIVHSDIFAMTPFGIKWEPVGPFMGAFMLGSFFFMAGYFAEYSRRKKDKGVLQFYWSKFIRLFPPYWLALALFMLVLDYSLKPVPFALYFFNVQIIFAPTYLKLILTLWYLSALFVYYLVFGFMLSRSTRSLMIWAAVVFAVSYALSLMFDLFDDRFFEYFFIFLSGILLARYDEIRERILHTPLPLALGVGLLGAVLFGIFELGDYRVRSVYYLIASNLYIFSWIVLALRFFRSGRVSWPIWKPIAYASFFAYLLHRPVWYLLTGAFHVADATAIRLFFLVPGSIAAIFISYYMQKGYDWVLKAGARFWDAHMKPGETG